MASGALTAGVGLTESVSGVLRQFVDLDIGSPDMRLPNDTDTPDSVDNPNGVGSDPEVVADNGTPASNPSNTNTPGCASSFHGDMLVRTIAGYTPIRDLTPGISVWARNENNGEMGYREVTDHRFNNYQESVYTQVRDVETGAVQTIISNRTHPIFVQIPQEQLKATGTDSVAIPVSADGHVYQGQLENGYWMDAQNLKPGYRLLNDNNTWAEVVSLEVVKEALTAYNLTVDGFHTYFVAANDNADPIWVHNADCFNVDRQYNHSDLERANDLRSDLDQGAFDQAARDRLQTEGLTYSSGGRVRFDNFQADATEIAYATSLARNTGADVRIVGGSGSEGVDFQVSFDNGATYSNVELRTMGNTGSPNPGSHEHFRNSIGDKVNSSTRITSGSTIVVDARQLGTSTRNAESALIEKANGSGFRTNPTTVRVHTSQGTLVLNSQGQISKP